ncbi:hypothetical protein B0H14DRAFT_2578613 [Mycena olivaceomarginata]|nr:hypothetical protein B0H14DRAFT_2578613 [Mycena olivaceomarginata]
MGAPSTASSAPTPTGLAVIQPPVHSSTAGPSSAAAAKKKRAWNPSGESTSQNWRQGQIKAASIIIGVNTEFSKVACSTSLQQDIKKDLIATMHLLCRLIGMVRLSSDPLATFEAIFKSAHMHYFTNSSVVFYEYNWGSAAPHNYSIVLQLS